MRQRHGLSGTSEHAAWNNMILRCTNPKSKSWKYYGGRGIKVCERWKLFLNFIEDIGWKSDPLLTLERIDVDKDYEPGNVKWATSRDQSLNRQISEITGRRRYSCTNCGQVGHNSQTCSIKIISDIT